MTSYQCKPLAHCEYWQLHTHMHVHTHMYTHMHVHTCMYTHACTHMHVHTHACTHMHVHTHACTQYTLQIVIILVYLFTKYHQQKLIELKFPNSTPAHTTAGFTSNRLANTLISEELTSYYTCTKTNTRY